MYTRVFLLICTALILAACGGGDGGGGSGTDPGNNNNNNNNVPLGLEANFNSIQTKLFDTTCAVSGCHLGSSAPHGLQLSAGDSYGLLVGVPSGGVPALNRVEPFDPDNSYLIQKLEGTAAVGLRMPRGGTPLVQSDIDAIRLWISNGAMQTTGGLTDAKSGTGSFRVQTTQPTDGAVVSNNITHMLVVFTQPPDINTVFSEAFEILGSGGDGSFMEGNEILHVPARAWIPQYNAYTVILDVNSADLKPDTYRLRVGAKRDYAIRDFGANQLGGNFLSTFVLE